MRFTEKGEARTRKGYLDSDIDLGSAGKEFLCEYIDRHDVTFFAGDTTVKYYNWSTGVVYDIGSTFSVDLTDIAQYNGDLYGINATDGLQYINVSKLTADASTGAGSVFINKDAAARLDAITATTGSIRIEDTDYAFNAVDASTGEITLNAVTLSADYDTGAIATILVDKSSGNPKGTNLFFWVDTLHIYGVNDNTVDNSPYTLFFSEPALATTFENIFNLSATNTEVVGDGGVLKNAIVTKNYCYLFTDNATYSISKGDINTVTGARPPEPFTRLYGTVNDKSVAVMGDSIVWLTQNKRLMLGQVRLEAGQLNIDISEAFDAPVKALLDALDDDQSQAILYYQTKSKLLHARVQIEGETVELIYDNNIGVWCPPDTNKYFTDYFERNGEPYAMAEDDDTIYQLDEGSSDEGADIECIIAFGEFEGEDGRVSMDLKKIEVSGSIALGTIVTYAPRMNYAAGTTHELSYLDSENITGESIGFNTIGLSLLGGSATIEEEREFDKPLGNYPAKVRSFQPIFTSLGEDYAFAIKSWSVRVKEYQNFISTAI